MLHVSFDNSYTRLPDRFYARVAPTPVKAPRLIKLNVELARELGLDPDQLARPDGVEVLAGKQVAAGSDPIAMAYAGHQFGHFVPQLGDGRAHLIGEIVDVHGRRRDVQLKGSGPTPFSRSGDGRAALGPVLREYIVSEAMAAMGIPTTRSLAAVATGEMVARETFLPGAVLTRVAASHIRIGTFQFFAARGDVDGLKLLADHVITRHYPEAAEAEHPYRALLAGVVRAQADLIPRWLGVGFIHGVMNTDNMSIAGETIDYGPCAFMDTYNPGMVFSSIDQGGRYAYANQPSIAAWNLTRLAETLLPLLANDTDEAVKIAEAVLDEFPTVFQAGYLRVFRAKLGLASAQDDDRDLIGSLLTMMAENQADFTLTFRGLGHIAGGADPKAVRDLFIDPTAFDRWAALWLSRIDQDGRSRAECGAAMLAVNPAYIPRNHLIEEAIAAAVAKDDFSPFLAMTEALERPFEEAAARARYAEPPAEHERVRQTFCGT